jgi:hypothetical protein
LTPQISSDDEPLPLPLAVRGQGCQMVCFLTKNPNFGNSWRKILVYFMSIWSILRPLEIFHGQLVNFVAIWYLFPHFGILKKYKKNLATLICTYSVEPELNVRGKF